MDIYFNYYFLDITVRRISKCEGYEFKVFIIRTVNIYMRKTADYTRISCNFSKLKYK